MQDLAFVKNKEIEEKLRTGTELIRLINAPQNKLRNCILKAKSPIIILGGNEIINRKAVEDQKVDILLSPERNNQKDNLFFRNSGLNHILCKLAKENNVAIGFNFSYLLNSEGKERSIILGRMIQNAKLCKKYKVNMIFASFAKNKYELRSKSILESFKRVVTKP